MVSLHPGPVRSQAATAVGARVRQACPDIRWPPGGRSFTGSFSRIDMNQHGTGTRANQALSGSGAASGRGLVLPAVLVSVPMAPAVLPGLGEGSRDSKPLPRAFRPFACTTPSPSRWPEGPHRGGYGWLRRCPSSPSPRGPFPTRAGALAQGPAASPSRLDAERPAPPAPPPSAPSPSSRPQSGIIPATAKGEPPAPQTAESGTALWGSRD